MTNQFIALILEGGYTHVGTAGSAVHAAAAVQTSIANGRIDEAAAHYQYNPTGICKESLPNWLVDVLGAESWCLGRLGPSWRQEAGRADILLRGTVLVDLDAVLLLINTVLCCGGKDGTDRLVVVEVAVAAIWRSDAEGRHC